MTQYHDESRFYCGLDLGQSADYTAACILERTRTGRVDPRGRPIYQYGCGYLDRFALGTAYPEIVTRIGRLMGSAELRPTRHTQPAWRGAVRILEARPPCLCVDAS